MNRAKEIERAAAALVAKLDECQPYVESAFLLQHLRCGPYDGPQYGDALETLRRALRGDARARRAGRVKGGHARAAILSPARRSEIAQVAARARWARQAESTA